MISPGSNTGKTTSLRSPATSPPHGRRRTADEPGAPASLATAECAGDRWRPTPRAALQSRHRYGTIPPPPPNHVHWGRRWGLVARSARSKGEPTESRFLPTLWCGPCGGVVTTRSAPLLTSYPQTCLVKGEPDRTASAPQVREQDRHSLNLGILHALRYAWSRSTRDRSFPRSGLG